MTTEFTPSSIVIRSYQPSDLAACREIFTTANSSDEHSNTYLNYALETDMADIEKNYLQVRNGHWWVAVLANNNRVVGHIAALPLSMADPSYYNEVPEDERDHICVLRRMAVAPDVQRLGVGSKLLSTLIDFARDKGYRQVHLTTSNYANLDQVCKFYERNGFKKGRIAKRPFSDAPAEKFEDAEEGSRNISKPVIFEAGTTIPDEDLRLMRMSPILAKYFYTLQYFLTL